MKGRIVGIGIGEDIEILWRDVDARGNLLTEPSSLVWTEQDLNDPSLSTDAHDVLHWALDNTRSNGYQQIFDGVVGVAFSAIGRVDRQKRQLLNAVRKNWKVKRRGAAGTCAIDFAAIRDEFFPQVEDKYFLANNDAPCVALAERELLPEETSIFFITVNDGINVGVVHQGFELDRDDHPSFGHAYPRPHPRDERFSSTAACPHGTCFDALASATRIRESWGSELCDLPADHSAWDIISYYIAQLCVAGDAMFRPNRIILGGTVLWGGKSQQSLNSSPAKAIDKHMLPLVRRHYAELRGTAYMTVRPDQLIQRGQISELANGRGALALARVPHLSSWVAR